MLLKTVINGVTRFLNTNYVVSAKYWDEMDGSHAMEVSTTTGDMKLDGELAKITKTALETAVYLTTKTAQGVTASVSAERLRGDD